MRTVYTTLTRVLHSRLAMLVRATLVTAMLCCSLLVTAAPLHAASLAPSDPQPLTCTLTACDGRDPYVYSSGDNKTCGDPSEAKILQYVLIPDGIVMLMGNAKCQVNFAVVIDYTNTLLASQGVNISSVPIVATVERNGPGVANPGPDSALYMQGVNGNVKFANWSWMVGATEYGDPARACGSINGVPAQPACTVWW